MYQLQRVHQMEFHPVFENAYCIPARGAQKHVGEASINSPSDNEINRLIRMLSR